LRVVAPVKRWPRLGAVLIAQGGQSLVNLRQIPRRAVAQHWDFDGQAVGEDPHHRAMAFDDVPGQVLDDRWQQEPPVRPVSEDRERLLTGGDHPQRDLAAVAAPVPRNGHW
jgi:hypothetical protein